MRLLPSVAISVGVYSALVEGLVLEKRQDQAPRVLGLGIQRKNVDDPVKHDAAKVGKRATVLESLSNGETLYFAKVTIGTPAQTIALHIDTGSSDLWVNTPSSQLCSQQGNACAETGTYTANSSTTYRYVGDWFDITYVDGSGAAGDYATDTVTISNVTLSSLQFGIGYTSTSLNGLLGIGYERDEAQVNTARRSAYANLPAALAANSFTQSNAYSLWLDDLDSSTGSILFGGVDTAHFEGTLTTLPVQTIDGVYAEFLVTLTSISYDSTNIANNLALAVLLDSGTSLIYLPNAIVSAIYKDVGATYLTTESAAYVPCSTSSSTDYLNFTFSSVTISVPMSELVLEINEMQYGNGQRACLFGIAPSGTDSAILGDTFLRSAYVVYDIANNEISLAQAKFGVTTSNILEIGTGSSAVPSATAAPNPVAATAGVGDSSLATTVATGLLTVQTALGAADSMRPPPLGMVAAGMVAAAYML